MVPGAGIEPARLAAGDFESNSDSKLGVAFTVGFKGWLTAIPDSILQLFGVVMTGYVAGRSWEKVKGAAK